jgi:hypothetical protein
MDTAAEWLILADDAKELADRAHDPEARRELLIVALGYVRLARHAARFADTNLPVKGDEAEVLRLRGRSSANPQRADRT